MFLPTEVSISIDFYGRVGWLGRFREDSLALIDLGTSRIFLQKYDQKEWADNTMVHLVVDDAAGWHEVAERVKRQGGFDEVEIRAPQREDYGAWVTHVIDPAGGLLHFANLDCS